MHDHGWREFWAFCALVAFVVTAAIAFGWVAQVRHPTIQGVLGGFAVATAFVTASRWP